MTPKSYRLMGRRRKGLPHSRGEDMVSPCLEATYGVDGRCGPVDLRPYIEDTLMILPRPSRSPRSLEIESNHLGTLSRRMAREISHSWSTITASSSF